MYNSAATIVRCLNSVINQTYDGEIEIIIINDGSEDNSKNIVDEFIKEHKEFKIHLINKVNGGVSSARNVGLQIAKGNYIALLDSDDEWFLDKLEKQINLFLCEKKYSFFGCLIYEPNNKLKGKIKKISLEQLVIKNYFQPSTVIFKKDILSKIGLFDEAQKYAEEGNYFMRIANSYHCGLLYEQLVLYDQGKPGFGFSGLSANLFEMEKGELKNLSFAYKKNYISFLRYLVAVIFSIIKYFRRVFIVKLNKLKNDR